MITKKISQFRHTKSRSNKTFLRLLPLNKISHLQLQQLSQITRDKEVMKYIGKGNIWSLQDLKTFIKDEQNENKKTPINRQYYTFVMLYNNDVIGFIAGRKNKSLLGNNSISPHDLLLRMFISRQHTGKGYGKTIIKLFIAYYSNLIKSRPLRLISDIEKNNISSIKIHLANKFKYTNTITYPNKHQYDRYILTI